ncbi:unnamed protein product [Malus baccata var. baccata]
MKRLRTIDSFFKKRDDGDKLESDIPSVSNDNAPISTEQPHDSHQTSNMIEPQEKVFDDASLELERDPGKRIQIHEGHDESMGSKNRGNFIELVKHTAKFNDKVAAVVLENAPKNAKYSSPMIQKEVLNILANIVRRKIREEVGDDIVWVEDTTATTLHREIKKVFAFHELPINKLRGQGYDGASNMRGSIVNVITTSPKRHTQLQVAHTVNIEELEIMGITDILCRELQNKSQDILNAMNLVTTTKDVLQKLRLDGWATFIDKLAELNSRFSEEAMELLILSSALEPREAFKAFNIDHICKLAEKFYSMDFTEKELHTLRCELKIYESDVPHHPVFQKMSTTSELCRGFAETKRSERYNLIDRLIRLVLTLPVSTATTERAFSAMNLIKTRRRNKMESEFLADSMVVYIEKELAEKIDSEEITKDFNSIKDRRAQLE